MDFLFLVVLGIIEGITEFLPISSTGHIILASKILGVSNSKIMGTFEIAIQLGPILAVTLLYYQKLLSQKNLIYKALVGFIPTGILGLLVYKKIKLLLQNEWITVASLFLGGIAIIVIEWFFKNKKWKTKSLTDMTFKDAFLVGLIQSLAMIPGVSRSASSIFGGMALKLDRKSAVEFSFFLAIPTMVVATGYDLLKNISKFNSSDLIAISLGTLVSSITAIIVIKWLMKYVQTNDFTSFAIYRIVFALLYVALFLH